MADQLLPGFFVRPAKRSLFDHWQGGRARHAGSQCRICDRPLLLLWSINASDPRFQVRGRSPFKHLARLPLYYCWTCAGEICYSIVAPDRIDVIRNVGTYQGDDFPYRRYPTSFPRRPIELSAFSELPTDVKKTLQLSAPADRLSPSEQRAASAWFGHRVQYGFDLWWHQFGGSPRLIQGPECFLCPNTACSRSRRKIRMNVLAAIINDPPGGLPMIEPMREVRKAKGHFDTTVQVIFHICRGCLTIHACNRCD